MGLAPGPAVVGVARLVTSGSGVRGKLLIYCRAGSGRFDIDGHGATLAADHALLIPRGRPHSYAAGDRAARLFRDCFHALAGGLTLAAVLYASQAVRHLLATLFFDNAAFTSSARAPRQPRLEDEPREVVRYHRAAFG
jgi:hypothetical protein